MHLVYRYVWYQDFGENLLKAAALHVWEKEINEVMIFYFG